jgi:hypothetical protein
MGRSNKLCWSPGCPFENEYKCQLHSWHFIADTGASWPFLLHTLIQDVQRRPLLTLWLSETQELCSHYKNSSWKSWGVSTPKEYVGGPLRDTIVGHVLCHLPKAPLGLVLAVVPWETMFTSVLTPTLLWQTRYSAVLLTFSILCH